MTNPVTNVLGGVSLNKRETALFNAVLDLINAIEVPPAATIDLLPIWGTPTNSVAATNLLTFAGTANGGSAGEANDGETITIGSTVYEFDTNNSITAGRVRVDISAGAVAAAGVLTIGEQVTLGDTFTIGTRVFTIVPAGTANAAGEVPIGTNEANTKLNIVASINGTDTVANAHPLVSAAAFDGDTCAITARAPGTAGNSIATTSTFGNVANAFGASALAGGDNMTAANQMAAFISAASAHATVTVAAVNGEALQASLTAKTVGTAGNSIVTTETLANGSFSTATLTGGTAGTAGARGQIMVDASYVYVAVQTNTATSAVWKRASIS